MSLKKILFVIIIMILSLPVFAERQSMPPLTVRTAASNGFGGHHVAYTDNIYSLLVNPAAMIDIHQWSVFSIALSLLSPQQSFGMLDSVAGFADGDDNAIPSLLRSLNDGKMVLGFEIHEFPLLSFAWVNDGFGVGIMTNTLFDFNIIGFNMEVNVFMDVILPVGFAFTVLDINSGQHTLDAGFTAKAFTRFMINDRTDIISMADDMDVILDGMNMPVIVGGGFDFGLLYRWDKGFSAGLTFDDLISHGKVMSNLSESYTGPLFYYVPLSINLGVAYDFRIGRFFPNAPSFLQKSGIVAAADWRNIINMFNQDDPLNRNSSLDFGFGVQLYIWDTFYFRIGLNEMLPAAGIGLRLGILELDVAYYGREYGYEPGHFSAALLELSIAIRPGSEPKKWPWVRPPMFSR